jgi:hypothetical protein
VIVRNQVDAPLSFGFVWVVHGKLPPGKLVRDIDNIKIDVADARALPVRPENAPELVRPKLHTGDTVTKLPAIEPGEISVCAIGASGNLSDSEYTNRFDAHVEELPLTCVVTTMTAEPQVIVVAVPPMKRLD